MIRTGYNLNNPLITVIVPIYHVEKYLHRCIDSIIGQTYKNLEIILVDDGSGDACSGICDEYARKDSRIVVIHKENGGLSDARNKGIEIAKGEYLAFVDSDDYIHKDMYSILMEALIQTDSELSMCSYKYVYDGRPDEIDESIGTDHHIEVMDGVKAHHRYYSGDKKLELTVAWNKLYKKDLFSDLRYPKGRIFEDEFTTYKALYKCSRICFVDLPLYYYLQRSDSIIGVMNGHRDTKVVEAYLQRIDFYRDNNEDALWREGIMHCLHMMCYFNMNCVHSDGADDGMKKCYRKEFLSAVNNYSQASKGFNARQKFEIALYKLNAGLYLRIWRMTKRN